MKHQLGREKKSSLFEDISFCTDRLLSKQAPPPPLLSLHWDGKKLKNSDGETYEAEVILVAGAPDYVEGKILGKFGQLIISHCNSTFTQMLFTWRTLKEIPPPPDKSRQKQS